jgi:two-component system, cell cycle sensor histidine kinase and response regulator CckA
MEHDRDISQSVFQTVRRPLVVLDDHLRVTMASRSFYETFHAIPEGTEGRPFYQLGGGQWNIPELKALLQETLSKDSEFNDFEVDREFPHIGRRTMLLNARPFREGNGSGGGILLGMDDITERRRAEAALRESEQRFAAFMNNTPAVAFMRNESGRYVYVNRAFELVTGKAASEVVGRTAFDVWPAEIAGPLMEHDRMVIANDGPVEITEKTLSSDGSEHEWLAVKFPMRDLRGNLFVGDVSIDVTERRRLQEQLGKSQKMEAIGRLAGGLTHDFNNLLTIISGYAQLLSESFGPDAPQQTHLQEILKAGERAAELTRQLLAFSRQQPLAPVVLDLSKVVQGVEKMLRRLIGENIDLRTVLEEKLFTVLADPAQMEQVLLNLAVNARDAMPEGGSLTIETSNVPLDELYAVEHPLVTPGDYVLVAVTDTGVGMNAETQARIFEPFFTTKEQGKGTGLGLATVYGIVKQSGGFIWLYSEPGKGSTFKIYLPRAVGGGRPAAAQPGPAEILQGTETILLVEDDAGVRELAGRILLAGGYKLLKAAHPEEAVRLFDQHPGPIHLLLTDVVMPGTNGRELASRLVSKRPEMKVLFMSGYTKGSVVHQGVLELGAHLLQKPFSPEQLLRKVRGALNQ